MTQTSTGGASATSATPRPLLGRVLVPGTLMRRPELLNCLQVSQSVLYREIAKGKLPRPLKIGGRSLWRTDDVLAILDAQRGGQ